MKIKRLLWLDDSRNPLTDDWLVFSPIERPFDVFWVKSYDEFVSWIRKNGLPDAICFDHDLGKIVEEQAISKGIPKKKARQMKQEEKTGMDCAKWLVEYCMDNKMNLPKWNCQSSNPGGRDNINGLLVSFMKNVKF